MTTYFVADLQEKNVMACIYKLYCHSVDTLHSSYFLYYAATHSHSSTIMSILSYFNFSRNSNLDILKTILLLLCLFNFHSSFLSLALFISIWSELLS